MAKRQEWYTVNDDVDGANMLTAANFEAQTFTLGTTGNNLTFNLTTIKLKLLHADSNSVWICGVYNTLPDGSPDFAGGALSTGTRNDFISSGTDLWETFTMTSTTLQASQQYSIVVNVTTGIDNAFWREDETAPAYGGGNGWGSTDSGATWTTAAVDKMFQVEGGTYDGTLCTLADAANKAGALASAAAKEEVLMSDYVKQAEGRINATTRFNWVNAYSGLSEDVKYILNDCASNLAAIYAITYDMSGFTDRVEAETMINVYRDAALAELATLKSKQVKTFITGDT